MYVELILFPITFLFVVVAPILSIIGLIWAKIYFKLSKEKENESYVE